MQRTNLAWNQGLSPSLIERGLSRTPPNRKSFGDLLAVNLQTSHFAAYSLPGPCSALRLHFLPLSPTLTLKRKTSTTPAGNEVSASFRDKKIKTTVSGQSVTRNLQCNARVCEVDSEEKLWV